MSEINEETPQLKDKVRDASDLAQDILKDVYSRAKNKTEETIGKSVDTDSLKEKYQKGGKDKNTLLVSALVAIALTVVIFISRFNNWFFGYALFALVVLLGYYRPKVDKNIFRIALAAFVVLFIITLFQSVSFWSIIPIILLYVMGEAIRLVGWTLGGYISGRQKTPSVEGNTSVVNATPTTTKNILVIIAAVVAGALIIIGAYALYTNYVYDRTEKEYNKAYDKAKRDYDRAYDRAKRDLDHYLGY